MKFILVGSAGRSGSTLIQGLLNSIDGVLVSGEKAGFVFELAEGYRILCDEFRQYESDELLSPTHPHFASDQLVLQSYLENSRNLILQTLFGEFDLSSIKFVGYKEIVFWNKSLLANVNYFYFLKLLFPDIFLVMSSRNYGEIASSKWWNLMPNEVATCTISCCYGLLHTSANFLGISKFLDLDLADLINNPIDSALRIQTLLGTPVDLDKFLAVTKVQHSY